MKYSSVIACTVLAAISCTSLASSAPVSEARARALSAVTTILGPEQQNAVSSFVDDAKRRISEAMRAVAAKDEPPRAVLTLSQKFAVASAKRDGSEPDLRLNDGQRAELNVYFTDLAAAVAPIAREDGQKIDAVLSSDRRENLAKLRDRSTGELDSWAGGFGFSTQLDAFAAAARFRDGIGAFVLLVEIDPRSLVTNPQ